MKISIEKLKAVIATAENRQAIFRAAQNRRKHEHSLWAVLDRRARQLAASRESYSLLADRERISAELDEVLREAADAQKALDAARSAVDQAQREWDAAARLAARCREYAQAGGVNIEPAPYIAEIMGPDPHDGTTAQGVFFA